MDWEGWWPPAITDFSLLLVECSSLSFIGKPSRLPSFRHPHFAQENIQGGSQFSCTFWQRISRKIWNRSWSTSSFPFDIPGDPKLATRISSDRSSGWATSSNFASPAGYYQMDSMFESSFGCTCQRWRPGIHVNFWSPSQKCDGHDVFLHAMAKAHTTNFNLQGSFHLLRQYHELLLSVFGP